VVTDQCDTERGEDIAAISENVKKTNEEGLLRSLLHRLAAMTGSCGAPGIGGSFIVGLGSPGAGGTGGGSRRGGAYGSGSPTGSFLRTGSSAGGPSSGSPMGGFAGSAGPGGGG
jgi:hypothetical protein